MTDRDFRARPLEVLVVDDDETFTNALAMFLDHDERLHVLTVARDLQTALASAREQAFDVALVDVRLAQGEEGFGVVEALRELDASLVAVMMSGLDRSEFEERAYRSGAAEVLQKTDLAAKGREALVQAYLAAQA